METSRCGTVGPRGRLGEQSLVRRVEENEHAATYGEANLVNLTFALFFSSEII
jgi:hypothetical protein